MKISVRELHLAAYIKSNGGELVSLENGHFHFATNMSETDWRVRHINSCCIKVDNEMLSLKRMIAR